MTEPSAVDLTTGAGTTVRLRHARADDTAALQAGFTHLSEDSRYTRFFTAVPRLSGALLHQLTDLDGRRRLAIAVFDPSRPSEVGGPDGYGIGVARLIQPDPEVSTAELAIAVIDEYHHRGIGTVMLAALLVCARANGLDQIEAYVLATNSSMIHLLVEHGSTDRREPDDDTAVRHMILDVSNALAHADAAVIAALAPLAPLQPFSADRAPREGPKSAEIGDGRIAT